MNPFPNTLKDLLQHRKDKQLFRSLKTTYPTIDFSSNDYLGFSSRGLLYEELKTLCSSKKIGSTGSRLISGDSILFKNVEQSIAHYHQAESALIYNSGYDANVGLLSCVPQKGDLILSDELIHASLIDGIRLSHATHYKFKHNDITSLLDLIIRHKESFQEIYVVAESVYSMDGDCAPLVDLADLCKTYQLHLIVDEAHAIGVFGEHGHGLCQALGIQQDCFARIYTYGKAMGCHGAAIVGSEALKHYLINFSRSFIYTTAMPEHSVLAIKAAYQLLSKTTEIYKLKQNINYFNTQLPPATTFVQSHSAIHCKLVSGNQQAQDLEDKLSEKNFYVKAIKSPTVKETQERLRVCLHAFNTKQEMDELLNQLENL